MKTVANPPPQSGSVWTWHFSCSWSLCDLYKLSTDVLFIGLCSIYTLALSCAVFKQFLFQNNKQKRCKSGVSDAWACKPHALVFPHTGIDCITIFGIKGKHFGLTRSFIISILPCRWTQNSGLRSWISLRGWRTSSGGWKLKMEKGRGSIYQPRSRKRASLKVCNQHTHYT